MEVRTGMWPAFGLIVGTTLLGLMIYYNKRRKYSIPTEWRAVGEITDLMCFPIKSCGVIRVTDINCTILGLEDELLRDRIFMVVNQDGNFVTARTHPKLVRILPKVNGRILKLTAAGMLDISVDIDKVIGGPRLIKSVWDQNVEVVDCGEDIAKWISRFLLKKDDGFRLVYYPFTDPRRPIRPKNRIFADLDEQHVGALHDATSFMMINENSIAELNSRLDSHVTALHFRPNFVMKGPPAFAEDDFKWVRIGNETIFKVVKPCTRCVFTTVDPETGEKNLYGEPLKTLKSYRKFPGLGESPVMGIHLGVVQYGKVKMGDVVYIGK